ncbi:MAG: Crp/Fnr family transcriptional regulator [Telmatospirillum sp.]|nr:Crp/Fnr family transcriptional regulator [Telmatospirillum sp.]
MASSLLCSSGYGVSHPMSRCFSILDILENPEHDSLFQGFTLRRIEERGIVCDANSTENDVFIVLSGELRVYLSYEGREFTVFTLEPEAVFTTHSKMTVVAKTHSEILVTSLRAFTQAISTVPGLAVPIIASMGQGLANTIGIIEGLVFRDVRHRLIQFLLDLAGERGRRIQTGVLVTVDCNTEDIATLIGSSRQSTSLILNELIKAGYLLRVNRKQFVIRDPDALRALTGAGDLPAPPKWHERPQSAGAPDTGPPRENRPLRKAGGRQRVMP